MPTPRWPVRTWWRNSGALILSATRTWPRTASAFLEGLGCRQRRGGDGRQGRRRGHQRHQALDLQGQRLADRSGYALHVVVEGVDAREAAWPRPIVSAAFARLTGY